MFILGGGDGCARDELSVEHLESFARWLTRKSFIDGLHITVLNAYAREFRPRSESKERSFQVMRPIESSPVDVVNGQVHLSGVSPFRNSQRTSFLMDKTSKLKG